MSRKHKSLETIIPLLPRRTISFTGKPCEPISILVLGGRTKIHKAMSYHRWYPAVGITPFSALRAMWAAALNHTYLTGPVFPLFVLGRHHQLAFQRPTRSNTYRRRHHLRLWKTPHLVDGHRVWVGMLSYDRGAGFTKRGLFPTHHISSNLDSEENFFARTLGILEPTFVRITEPEIGVISNGDPYTWDGKALVIEADKVV